ncbi:PHB depolymerase family esterase [Chryseobacterium sp. OSA05B]|uniref:alpha/beta hydrolase family esterase n=1 Tax=Chryseobacterium sp. OSA05B TaxID=2862650 RepID=UPI001CBFE896|nr:PHB depolymerase family esterase [Chryseobacterium sp. OSA05B]
MTRNFILLFVTALFSHALLGQTKSLQHNDVKRKYIVYTPKGYDPGTSRKYPVIFNFHGGGMTPAEQMLYTQMNRTADQHNFIAVYPKGIKEDWNVGFGMSYKKGTDDMGFVEALLNQIEKDYKVDPKKVFATGLSRGGFFCHRIAAELPHRFSAIATAGASLPDSVAYYHKDRGEIGVLMVHGKADVVVDYAGKEGGYFSALKSYQYWQKQNYSTTDKEKMSKLDQNKNDQTSAEIIETKTGKKYVTLISIENAGHTWPGADDFNIGLPIGLTSKEIDFNEYMWAFFNKQE